MQMITTAGNPAEHGIGGRNKFYNNQITRQLRRKVDNFHERNAIGDHHVMNDGKHQQSVKVTAGPLNE